MDATDGARPKRGRVSITTPSASRHPTASLLCVFYHTKKEEATNIWKPFPPRETEGWKGRTFLFSSPPQLSTCS